MKKRTILCLLLLAALCLALCGCKQEEKILYDESEVQFAEDRANAAPEQKFDRTLSVTVDAAHSDPRKPYTRADFPDIDIVKLTYGVPHEVIEIYMENPDLSYFYGEDAEFDWEAFKAENPEFAFQWRFTVTLPKCDAAYAQAQADKFNALEGFEAKETEYPKVYEAPEGAE